MDTEYILSPSGDLYHWGIKGMKWGIRRYQNKDGSLTPAGKKRYADESDGKTVQTAKRKSVRDMSDEELDRAIARARKEDEYLRYRPEPKPKVKFGKRVLDEVITPAVLSSGKKALEGAIDKLVKKALSDKIDPNSLEGIEFANKRLRAQIENKLLNKGIDPNVKSENLTKWRTFLKDLDSDDAADNSKASDNDGTETVDSGGTKTQQVNNYYYYSTPVSSLPAATVSRGQESASRSSVLSDDYVCIVDEDGQVSIVERDD